MAGEVPPVALLGGECGVPDAPDAASEEVVEEAVTPFTDPDALVTSAVTPEDLAACAKVHLFRNLGSCTPYVWLPVSPATLMK